MTKNTWTRELALKTPVRFSFYVSFGVHYDTNADKDVADISVEWRP